ncbi:Bug family tripartite tricarboxylate transporter substrate binding protein [Belnapia rosea]|uniref:Tripartite tricarboxylate transporter family receptor n=1 Tax=Belnapia rosea TaxID=938405 RepID=A0A1G6S4V0_9PROT|nr:tripartite tricarboxylate transporter substrate binding protein [Belnapia rosea]SDD11167.1 Tripartite tricarboxylate transporter family receptor [Belnapia rosea]
MLRRSLLGAALAAPGLARAQGPVQAWAPQRPIRFVVPFPAGGGTDVAARILAERLTEGLGQPVIVENRTGSGGNIGMENVVRSAPDGHAIVMGTTGTLTINPHLYPTLGFDPARDLAPVSLLPDVPTMAEIDLPGAESTSWGAVLALAGTPEPVVARLQAALGEAVAQPAVRARMAQAGADAATSTPAELASLMRRETERWGRVVREAGITVG